LAFEEFDDHFCGGSLTVRAADNDDPMREIGEGALDKIRVNLFNEKTRKC
jgi:hypothetical protein